ncbi:MAG TPA: carboxymuconolactone decarboxylase family protein [Acidobacteriota bacterium]|jgi:AhpD family alkylhydroperoxidase
MPIKSIKKNAAVPNIEDSPMSDKPSPQTDGKWPSYTMVEDRMRKIYFEFYRETYKSSVLDRKTKELVAIAASIGFKCQGCLEGHIKKALKHGASKQELSEAIAIAMGVAAAGAVDLTDIAAAHLKLKHFE